MCGIVGIINFRSPLDQPAGIVAEMNSALAHRGPDSAAVHVAFGEQVAIGHTLLSIVGTGTNSQPLRKQVIGYEVESTESEL